MIILIFKILFICTGNICRSPTAEAVLRALGERAGRAVEIETESAGIGDWHVGHPPDARARAAALLRGYDLEVLRARQVGVDDFDRFDLLLAMDRSHLGALERMRPDGARGAIRLFLEFAPGLGQTEVPDPYYGGPEGFERVLDMIEAGAAGPLAAISAGRI